jgi:hypothetical protein
VNDVWDDDGSLPPDPGMPSPRQPVITPVSGPGRGSSPRPAEHSRHARPAGDGAGPLSLSRRDPDEADDLVIRPFLLTGGRTRPAQEGLRVESLIHARPDVPRSDLRFEAHQIVELCQQPISLAELAAALRVPLGVARVLVSDLVEDGIVALVEAGELSVQMIERIRDRVRAL